MTTERKTSPKKVLAFGPEPEDQAKAARIEKWLRTPGLTLQQIAGMIEVEMGIKTSRSALSRYFDELNQKAREERILQSASSARAAVSVVKSEGVDFGAALEADLSQKAFEMILAGASEKQVESWIRMYATISRENQAKRSFQQQVREFEEATKTKQEKALDAFAQEIQNYPQLREAYDKFRKAVMGVYGKQEAA